MQNGIDSESNDANVSSDGEIEAELSSSNELSDEESGEDSDMEEDGDSDMEGDGDSDVEKDGDSDMEEDGDRAQDGDRDQVNVEGQESDTELVSEVERGWRMRKR